MIEIIPLYDPFKDNEIVIVEDLKQQNEQAALATIQKSAALIREARSAEELKDIANVITSIQKAFFDTKPTVQITNNNQNISNNSLQMFSNLLKADI